MKKNQEFFSWGSIIPWGKIGRIMKILTILLVATLVSFASGTYSQSKNLTFKLEQVSLLQVFQQIEKQSDMVIAYDISNINLEKKVDVDVNNASIDKVLQQALEGTDLSYRIMNRYVVISRDDKYSSTQQSITVSGKVTESTGAPIPGVSVSVKGTSRGVVSDTNGNYSLSGVSVNNVLVFSFVGMKTQEITVTRGGTYNVVLESQVETVVEVVVTALNIPKAKRAVGYSMQAIKGIELAQANTSNLISSLTGKLAGVNIINTNQLEGGSTRIVIRGNNSITGNNQPLFVIDGMPVENTYRQTNETGRPGVGAGENIYQPGDDFGTGINMINQNDIESIDVLKGPAAAALYGARGANGVVMITTKKGSKKEGIGVDFSYDYKVTNPYRFQAQQNKYGAGGFGMAQRTADWDKMYRTDSQYGLLMPYSDWDGATYSSVYDVLPYTGGLWDFDERAFSWHGYGTSWGPPMTGQKLRIKGPNGYSDGEYYMNNPQPNNKKDFFRNGITQNYNIAFSNAGDWGSVRVGLGNISNNAIVDNSGYRQTNVTLGANMNISKQLKSTLSLNYTDLYRLNTDVSAYNESYTKWAYNFPTNFNTNFFRGRYKNADGSKANGNYVWTGSNPVDMFWRLYEQNNRQYNDKFTGSIALHYSPTDFLDITGRVGTDMKFLEVEQKNNPTDAAGINGGNYSHAMEKDKTRNLSVLANFHKNNLIVNKLNVQLGLGAESWYRYYYRMSAGNNLRWVNPYIWSFGNYDLEGNKDRLYDLLPKESRLEKEINSVYGNLELSYDNFLYLQITGRNDWSSTLPISNNSYFYPSVNMSFVFDRFLSNWNWLSFGKVRLAFATAATDTDPYQLTPTFEGGSFANAPLHKVRADLPPVKLEPQYANTVDAGIDLRFLNNRINFEFTYYNTHSFNQIMSAPLPISSGFSSYKFNTGELMNEGIELGIGADIIKEKDWQWNLALNMAHNNNKLLSLDGETQSLYIGNIFGTTHGATMKVTVGQKYGAIYGWDYLYNDKGHKVVNLVYGNGAFANKVVGTTYKTTAEQVIIGNATPDFTGGVNTTLRWKSLSLYALADFSWGGDIYSGDYASAYQTGISPQTLSERDGNGLPYTYGDGSKANHGILMEGDLEDGTPNNYVVHYTWKYGRTGSWGGNGSQNQLTSAAIFKNNWVKMRELTLSWKVPESWARKTKVLQNASINLTGRDLFYIYTSLPDKLNPEALSNQAGNSQGIMFGALPGARSVTFGIKASF